MGFPDHLLVSPLPVIGNMDGKRVGIVNVGSKKMIFREAKAIGIVRLSEVSLKIAVMVSRSKETSEKHLQLPPFKQLKKRLDDTSLSHSSS